MLIQRSKEKDGNLLPRASNYLSSIPDNFLYHVAHQKRHPQSVYDTSLRLISEQWVRVFKQLDELNREHNSARTESSFPNLLHEYRELLNRLYEHHDACFSVLRSLCSPDKAKATNFDNHFLDKAKLPGWKNFSEAIRQYREDHLGVLVNTMKHRQGELNSIFFYSESEFRPGYFLRDLLPDGVIGPSAKLHSSGNTAFSFSRDMMVHLWWLYRIGDCLADGIYVAIKTEHNHDLKEAPKYISNLMDEVVSRCAELRPEFFPDEVGKPYPRIIYQKEPCKIKLEFPTTARGHKIGEMKVSVNFVIDGNHPTNKMPYFPMDRT